MNRNIARLARLGYWMACCSPLCLIWMAMEYPATRPTHLPPLGVQIVWWTLCIFAPTSVAIGALTYLLILFRSHQRQGLSYSIAAITVGLCACGVIVYGTSVLIDIEWNFRHDRTSTVCVSNVKQLDLSLLLYEQDYDERFPPASTWNSAILPYNQNQQLYLCPTEDDRSQPSYAMNRHLAQALSADIAEEDSTVSLIDMLPGANRVVGKSAYPFTARHGSSLTVGFADGHVKRVAVDKVLGLTWDLRPPNWKRPSSKKKR